LSPVLYEGKTLSLTWR